MILFCYYKTENRSNGGVNSLLQILNCLDRDFIVLSNDPLCLDIKNKHLKKAEVWPIGSSWKAKLKQVLSFNTHLIKLYRKYRFHTIIFNDIHAFLQAFPYSVTAAVKKVYFFRDVKSPVENYSLHWKFLRSVNLFLTLSSDMQRQLTVRIPGIVRRRSFKVLPSIVDPETFNLSSMDEEGILKAKLFGARRDSIHIVYVAALMDKKNQYMLIDNWSSLLAGSDIYLHLVGDFDPDRNIYHRRCLERAEQCQGNIIFHGFRDNITDYYKAADLVLVASRKEGLARCMIESLACGKPVASFDVASAVEVLKKNKLGAVVPQGDYKALWNQSMRLIDEHTAAQAQKAHEYVKENYSADSVIRKFEEYLDKVNEDR